VKLLTPAATVAIWVKFTPSHRDECRRRTVPSGAAGATSERRGS